MRTAGYLRLMLLIQRLAELRCVTASSPHTGAHSVPRVLMTFTAGLAPADVALVVALLALARTAIPPCDDD